jgi:hypothetical protein
VTGEMGTIARQRRVMQLPNLVPERNLEVGARLFSGPRQVG